MSSVLSIEMGSSNFHIVEGTSEKGSVLVEKAMTFRIPDECLSNERIRNQLLLDETLSEAIRLFNPKAKVAILTFNGLTAIVRDVDLPNAKPKELEEMLKTEFVQVYHMLPTDVLQYKSIDKYVDETGSQISKYRTVAMDREIIDEYHSLLTRAKIKPMALDMNMNAIEKLLAGEPTINDRMPSENGTMLIDYGNKTTTVYIVAKGKPLFHRQINSGCGEIERIICDETFTSITEIRKLKEQGYNFFGEDEAAKKYFTILRPLLYNLTDEIRKIIGFYSSRSSTGNGSIDHIYLYGGGSNLGGFAGYCESALNISTEQIKNISKVKYKDSEAQIASYLNSIGALIRN